MVNYHEFGFVDGRNKKPDTRWVLLRELAKNADRAIKEGTVTGIHEQTVKRIDQRGQLKKTVSTTRMTLREYFRQRGFDIAGDPIPYTKDIGYRTSFKTWCHPAFDS
jgi:hypothetical protein